MSVLVGHSLPADELLEPDDEIVVTATRLPLSPENVPASISVVTGDEIQIARQQLGLDEALARVPGAFFQNRYNFAQDLRIAIRGFGARSNFGVRGIKMFVDGIPETLADGQTQVDSIDLGSIRQVEVLRGPASALYGNAAGGVISIQSEVGGSEPFVEARIAAGDYGFSKYQLKIGGTAGRLDYLVSVSDLNIDGYRKHSEAENTQISSRFRFHPDDRSEFNLTISATDQPVSDDPGGLTRAAATADPTAAYGNNIIFNAGEALDQQKVGLSYSRAGKVGGTFAARTYFLHRDFLGRLPFTDGGTVVFDRGFAGAGVSYTQGFDAIGFRHRLITGIDYDRQQDDRQRYDNNNGVRGALVLDQVERVSSTGIFVQDEIALSERLDVTVGLRYDNIDFDVDGSGSRSISDVSPSTGFLFAMNDEHSVYGSIATAFETPTTTEFANPDGSGGFNPDLQPQQSTSYELGLRGALSDRSRYEVAVFHIDVDDELIPYEIATSPGRDFYANAGQSSRRGLEMSVSAEPLPGLSVALAYTWSQFEFDRFVDDDGNDYSGNTSPGVPNSFAHADVSYTHDSGFFIAVDAMYTDKMFANNANTATVDGATVANIRFGFEKSFDSLTIAPFVGINNLADAAYTSNVRINAFGGRFFEPGPERNFYGGVTLRYQD